MGTVVTKNVLEHSLMTGVPAKQIGWVCECGEYLDEELYCGKCKKDISMYKMD